MSSLNREVLEIGNPKLRQVAQTIEDALHPDLQKLIDDLMETMELANGVGMAAPQAGVNVQVMIVASRPTLRYPHAPHMDPIAMINPQITEQGAEQLKDWEGCLSVPGLRGWVPRSRRISVAYQDRQGNAHQHSFEGFVARIIQHECDHLQGVLFIDRLESTRDLVTEKEYHKRLIS